MLNPIPKTKYHFTSQTLQPAATLGKKFDFSLDLGSITEQVECSCGSQKNIADCWKGTHSSTWKVAPHQEGFFNSHLHAAFHFVWNAINGCNTRPWAAINYFCPEARGAFFIQKRHKQSIWLLEDNLQKNKNIEHRDRRGDYKHVLPCVIEAGSQQRHKTWIPIHCGPNCSSLGKPLHYLLCYFATCFFNPKQPMYWVMLKGKIC